MREHRATRRALTGLAVMFVVFGPVVAVAGVVGAGEPRQPQMAPIGLRSGPGGNALDDNTSRAGDTGTVTVKVKYKTSDRAKRALQDVEVFLWDGTAARYECTNAMGVAEFTDVPAGVDLVAATGPSVSSPRCGNAEFLNPDNGKKMLSVFWRNNHGTGEFDTFQVTADGTKVIKFVAKTPKAQKKVCAGLRTTWVGSNGDDIFGGTEDRDVINARGGDDVVNGAAGNDVICGGPGDDTLLGEGGDDWLFGEQGEDQLYGGPGSDLLAGGPQADVCTTGETLFDCETEADVVAIYPPDWIDASTTWNEYVGLSDAADLVGTVFTHAHTWGRAIGQFSYRFTLPYKPRGTVIIGARLSSEVGGGIAASDDVVSDVTLIVNDNAQGTQTVIADDGSGEWYSWIIDAGDLKKGVNRIQFAVLSGAENANGLAIYYDAVTPDFEDETITVIFTP